MVHRREFDRAPSHSSCRLRLAALLLALTLTGAGSVDAATLCIAPDNGSGTATLPPLGCEYTSSSGVYLIDDGLPAGDTIELAPTHKSFVCSGPGSCSLGLAPGVCEAPGGGLGGDGHCFASTLQLQVTGTGSLTGFSRSLNVPLSLWEVHSAPRIPGDPVQSFDTEAVSMAGVLFGDPDFCQFEFEAGILFGGYSPGHTTLRVLPSGDFNVESFFDVAYSIDYEGCPGSVLESFSGTSTGILRIETGVPLSGTCGDGTITIGLGEECDDGNTASEDGCSDACIVEFCGDGVSQAGLGETCDDGNMTSVDGCSDTCQSETLVTVLGTAQGGTLDYTIANVTVSITTASGQTADQVASALAAAINADATLSGLGIVAHSSGSVLAQNAVPTAFEGSEAGVALSTTMASLVGDLSVIPRTLDFENLMDGDLVADASSLEGITFGYSLDGETALATSFFETSSAVNSLGLSGGDDAFLDGDTLTLDLPRPVLAIGLFVVTSDPAAAGEILLSTLHGTTGNAGVPDGTTADGGHVYFLGHVAAEPFTQATLEFADDGGTHFVYNVDDITAAVPTDGSCGFSGTAMGGHVVGAVVDGVNVQIATFAGQTAADIAAALAAAINADATLQGLGTAAVAQGDQLLTNGTITNQTNTDPGLGGGAPLVPSLAPLALGLLAVLLGGAGVLTHRRRRRA